MRKEQTKQKMREHVHTILSYHNDGQLNEKIFMFSSHNHYYYMIIIISWQGAVETKLEKIIFRNNSISACATLQRENI